MKAILWNADRALGIENVPRPVAGPDDVIVAVRAGGICGSDITIKNGYHPRARAPLILGHEFCGILESMPLSGLPGFALGDRVVVEPLVACGRCKPCRDGYRHVCENLKLLGVETDGGFAPYARVPKECIHALPDTVPFEEGALLEPLAVGVHSVNASSLRKGDRIAIFGAGPIGLMIGLVARGFGHEPAAVFEVNEHRRARAASLGFSVVDCPSDQVVARSAEITGGKGFDVTFDAAGVPIVGETLLPVTAIKGRVMMTALYKKPCSILFRDLSYREQEIRGLRIYAAGDFAKAIQLVADGTIRLGTLVSGVFPMDAAFDAFEAAEHGKDTCKIVITMGE